MTLSLRYLAFLIAALTWTACTTSSENHGGATTETTNGITVAVTDSLGLPLADVTLRAFSSRNLRVLDTARTDQNGQASFRLDTAEAPYHLELVAGSDSARMAWLALPSTEHVTATLTRAASLTIHAESADGPAQLTLEGTPYRAHREQNRYHFARIPAGTFTLAKATTSPGGGTSSIPIAPLVVHPGTHLDTTMTPAQLQSLSTLFDNFDDGDRYHLLGSSARTPGWYIRQFDAEWLQPLSNEQIPQAFFTADAWAGRSLELRFDLKDTGRVQLGNHFGSDGQHYNLSALRSVRMAVRGDASFQFALEQSREVIPGMYNKVLWQGEADSEWRIVEFRPEDAILDSSSYQYTLAAVADSINILTLFIRSGTYLQIDDIVLEGIDPQIFTP